MVKDRIALAKDRSEVLKGQLLGGLAPRARAIQFEEPLSERLPVAFNNQKTIQSTQASTASQHDWERKIRLQTLKWKSV